MTNDYDSPWKDVLDAYFRNLLTLLLSRPSPGINQPQGMADLAWPTSS